MKLVINADDFGMSHTKNVAINEMMKNGVCTNVSLAVNMPDAEEAVSLAIANGYDDSVSLHLNLTEGESLTSDIRNIPLYYDGNKKTFAHRPIIKIEDQIIPEYIPAIRQEIEAQINKFLEFGLKLKSLDSHNWIHLRIPIWKALEPLIKKYSISIVRPMWSGYKRPEIASEKWSKYFAKIEPILLEHPECRVFSHTSNIEQFLVDEEKLRTLELAEVFTHPDLIEGEIIDLSSSYLGKEKGRVIDNVALISEYSKVTVSEVLKENA